MELCLLNSSKKPIFDDHKDYYMLSHDVDSEQLEYYGNTVGTYLYTYITEDEETEEYGEVYIPETKDLPEDKTIPEDLEN